CALTPLGFGVPVKSAVRRLQAGTLGIKQHQKEHRGSRDAAPAFYGSKRCAQKPNVSDLAITGVENRVVILARMPFQGQFQRKLDRMGAPFTVALPARRRLRRENSRAPLAETTRPCCPDEADSRQSDGKPSPLCTNTSLFLHTGLSIQALAPGLLCC